MNWKLYENEIFNELRTSYPEASVNKNVKRKGRYSHRIRQIDVLVEEDVGGRKITTVVEAKYLNKKIDVKNMESFIGMLQDVDADRGLLISQKGFTKSAENRANNDFADVEFDIFSLEELRTYQAQAAIPYAGSNFVLLGAPFGWVVDAKKYDIPALAFLYPRGKELMQAMSAMEFAYINFWTKGDGVSLASLIHQQEASIKSRHSDAEVSYSEPIVRSDANIKLRKVIFRHEPFIEYTGFVEFNDFIFFCVLQSPLPCCRRNHRKIVNLMSYLRPGKIRHSESLELE